MSKLDLIKLITKLDLKLKDIKYDIDRNKFEVDQAFTIPAYSYLLGQFRIAKDLKLELMQLLSKDYT